VAAVLAIAALVAAGCSPLVRDVKVLSSDDMGGRNDGTEGSAMARAHIIDRLDDFAVGLDPSQTGDASFTQPFARGTNVLALVPGTRLPDEYVILGAHYDGLGTSCRGVQPGDVCNGATDNATGVAAVLAIGEKLARHGGGPDRSVVLALWDSEEDGLFGSRHYVADPLVPIEQTVAYVNFDIQGANLGPSLTTTTFAIGAETGGGDLVGAVAAATRRGPLDTLQVSWIFGQGRSDYLPFIQAQVPTVFFSDSTGPCYHTPGDDLGAVDFHKLKHQIDNAARLARDLASGATTPTFDGDTPLASYEDALSLQAFSAAGEPGLARFTPEEQQRLRDIAATVDGIVAAGPDAFGPDDATALLTGAAEAVALYTSGDCDGFQRTPRRR
jgi:hypothetical protein